MTSALLVLSLSDIASDARVLKQVRRFADDYELTTCGLGDSPDVRVEHHSVLNLVPGRLTPLGPYVDALLLRLRLYRALYWRDPFVRRARALLRGRRFDAVLSNDVDTVPLALTLAPPSRVHIDLHEYFPGLFDDSPSWVRLRKPYYEWLVRRFATKAASVSTVGQGLADAYRANYGLECTVVTNATPYWELEPRPVGEVIRLVHSGVAQTGRQLELTMRAAARTRTPVTLDLFLMPSDLMYLDQLRALATELGDRVTVREPLGQSELVPALNAYDVGVFVLPPTTFNNTNALPNKFFDYVQARLGIIIGPSAEMVRLLEAHSLGVVSKDFTEDALVTVLDGLTPVVVETWKARADAAAVALSAERQVAIWADAIAALLQVKVD